MKKKKTIAFALTVLLIGIVAVCLVLYLPKPAPKEDDGAAIEGQVSARCVYEMEQNGVVYLPVVSGFVYSNVIPDEIRIEAFGAEQVLKMRTIDFVDGQYRIGFSENLSTKNMPGALYKGTAYEITVLVVMPETLNVVKVYPPTKFYVNDDYTYSGCANAQTGEISYGYLKESEWTEPYTKKPTNGDVQLPAIYL